MKNLLKLGFSIALLCLLFVNIRWQDLSSNLLLFSTNVILIGILLSFLAWAIAGLKWRILLPAHGFFELMAVGFVGQFYSTVLPGQITGEIAKAYRLGKGRKDAEHIAASVIVDKLTGMIGLLTVAVIGLVYSSLQLPSQLLLGFVLLSLLFLSGLFALKIAYFNKLIHLFLKNTAERWQGLQQGINRITLLLDGWVSFLNQPLRLISAFMLGVLFQLLCVLIVFVLADNLNIHVGFLDWCWIFGLVSMAVLLPVSFGGIGVREGTFAGALSLQGVPLEKSIALSLAVFAISLSGALIGGLLELQREVNSTAKAKQDFALNSARHKTGFNLMKIINSISCHHALAWRMVVSFGLCLMIIKVSALNLAISLSPAMNLPDFLAFMAALLALAWYVRVRLGSWSNAVVPLALCVFPLYLAIERCSQFLTVDETYIILESIRLKTSGLTQWRKFAFKTTEVLITPVIALESLLSKIGLVYSETALKMTWKLVHWLYAFGCLLWLHQLLNSAFVTSRHRTIYLTLFFFCALLLPTNILAFKIFNYDKLSLLLGVIALLYILIAWRRGRSSAAVMAIVTACLAAQEKLVASPILLLAIISYACLSQETGKLSLKRLFLRVLYGFAICLVIGIASVVAVYLVRSRPLPAAVWTGAMSPLSTWVSPIAMFVLGITGKETYTLNFQAMVLPISFAVCVATAFGLSLSIDFLKSKPRINGLIPALLPKVSLPLLIVCVLVGLISTKLVTGFWHPFAPIASGDYFPGGELNGATLHYGAHTLVEHLIKSIGFAYAVLVNGLPTGLWLLALFGLIRSSESENSENNPAIAAHVLIIFALLLPLAFGLLQIPVGNKYLNISFLLLVISFCLLAAPKLSECKSSVRAAVIGVIYIAVLAEVYPFRPLYLAFRPFWSNYPDASAPVPGKLSPSMSGWGEELMLGSELFEKDKQMGQGCAHINIFFNYQGIWLSLSPERSRFTTIPKGNPAPLSFNGCDYYLFTRHGSIQNSLINFTQFPASVTPDAKISFRGYDTAWLYRGDRLVGLPLKCAYNTDCDKTLKNRP